MIKKFLLPERSSLFRAGITNPDSREVAPNPFTRPLLPFLHEDSQRFSALVRHDKRNAHDPA